MITKTALGHAALLLLGIGAISPAAHAGTISACPTTVNAAGTWTVTKNLTATGTCVTITAAANGAAIDLNGHTITGPGSGTKGAVGITDSHSCTPSCQQNIIIANGTIKGFVAGIYLNSTKYATISNMNVMENGTGFLFEQDHVAVTGSQANNNAYGMYFAAGGSTVNNSQANDNRDWGMAFHTTDNTVNNSSANGNGGTGMDFAVGNGANTVNNSQANNNGGVGMYFGGGGNTITGSQANGNKGKTTGTSPINGGIYINGHVNGPGNFLAGNTANGNLDAGITVDCPSNLFGNTATGNGGSNIVLTPTSTGCARLDNNPAP